MKRDGVLKRLAAAGQDHILEHLNKLDQPERAALEVELERYDLDLVFRLYRQFVAAPGPVGDYDLKPGPVIAVPRTPEERARAEAVRQVGERLLRERKVAFLLVAGGQGTRLGFPGPKGAFPFSPLKKKTLFAAFAEQVLALNHCFRTNIPLAVMTSQENGPAIRDFFREHNFFGLRPENVFFFRQAMLPTITPDGRLVLKDRTRLLANPDGHGGALRAIFASGVLEQLEARGCEELFYCQVDNPLVKVADPYLLGCHHRAGAEMSLKVLRRRDAEEKVGIYGLVDDKPTVIEYSDLDPKKMAVRDPDGTLRYWAGSIAIHTFSLNFIRRLNTEGFHLPYHRAEKGVEGLVETGETRRLTAWKFETFVFDALPLARNSCCVETLREEEFAPIKNREGEDSTDTCRRALVKLHRRWLTEAGVRVAPGVTVEISPRYARSREELARRVQKEKITVMEQDTYLG